MPRPDPCRTRPSKPRHGVRRRVRHRPGAPALEAEQLTVCYSGVTALDSISLSLSRGTRLAVLGPNGAGKSTLLKLIAGVLQPTQGEIRVHGSRPHGHTCIAYLPQKSRVDWSFPLTVADAVSMGRWEGWRLLTRGSSQDKAAVSHALDQVGLSELADRRITELSGGQQQRMFVARALVQEAELILMDEPLAGLDVHAQRDLLDLVEQLPGDPTVLVALHELAIARDRFPQVLLLNRRVVAMGTPAEVFVPASLRDAYGGAVEILETQRGTLVVADDCCPSEEKGSE
jgi:manganese/iron transport system ATP-binding protein